MLRSSLHRRTLEGILAHLHRDVCLEVLRHHVHHLILLGRLLHLHHLRGLNFMTHRIGNELRLLGRCRLLILLTWHLIPAGEDIVHAHSGLLLLLVRQAR